MAKFTQRKTAPASNNKYYYSNINPWEKKGIGTCTQYAQGRALELQDKSGTTMKAYKDTWYPIDMYNRCSEIGGTKVKEPVADGCLIVWKKKDGSGSHIASVEAVTDQKDIYVSQMNSKNEFSYYKVAKNNNYAIDGYNLVGFVDLNLKWDTESKTTKKTTTTKKTADRIHIVKPGDSYWHICEIYYKNGTLYKKLMAYNGAKSSLIHPGDKIKVPEVL